MDTPVSCHPDDPIGQATRGSTTGQVALITSFLLEQTGRWLRPNHFGKERRETAEAGARRIIAETLRKMRLTSEGLKLLPANHRIKVGLALRLRRETTRDLKWIAQELAVGSWKYLSNLLNQEPHTSSQTEFAL